MTCSDKLMKYFLRNVVSSLKIFSKYTNDFNRCDSGYYGNPNQEGSTCERCQCSGNIDMNDLYGCDIETGECLRCLNNTTGPQCSQCKEWWYGDAVTAKNCRGMS